MPYIAKEEIKDETVKKKESTEFKFTCVCGIKVSAENEVLKWGIRSELKRDGCAKGKRKPVMGWYCPKCGCFNPKQ